MRCGKNDGVGQDAHKLARNGVDDRDTVDLIVKELYAQKLIRHVCGHDLHRVPAHAEAVTHGIQVVARIADRHQATDQLVTVHQHPGAQRDLQRLIFHGVTEGIDAGDRRHDDNVATLKQRGRCAVAQAVDLVVDKRVLFNIHILARDIRLGLVIIVVRHKKLHRVFGEKLAHFGADLCCERFVGLKDQHGAVALLDNICHGKGFSRARNAQKRLIARTVFQSPYQLLDCLRLVAHGRKGAVQLEFFHRTSPFTTVCQFNSITQFWGKVKMGSKKIDKVYRALPKHHHRANHTTDTRSVILSEAKIPICYF